MSRLYIAYGSNLNIEQMAHRCPTARIYSAGYLNNWELIYRGSKTGAYATIRRKKGSMVPIVVWEIQREDERSLDIYEGYPVFYFKQSVMASLPQGKKKAMVYIMDTSRLPRRPSQKYIDTIYEGYIDNDLDLVYLEESLLLNEEEIKKAPSFRWNAALR